LIDPVAIASDVISPKIVVPKPSSLLVSGERVGASGETGTAAHRRARASRDDVRP
jgi:hypothetical protein